MGSSASLAGVPAAARFANCTGERRCIFWKLVRPIIVRWRLPYPDSSFVALAPATRWTTARAQLLAPGAPSTECYRLGIKQEPRGTASNYIATQLRLGDILEGKRSEGSFVLRSGDRPVVLLSAGIGVTPVLAMLQRAGSGAIGAKRVVVHGPQWQRETLRRGSFAYCSGNCPHGRSWVQYSKPRPEDRPGVDFDAPGHLEMAVLDKLGVSREADFYLCAQPPFCGSSLRVWSARGVARGNAHTETARPRRIQHARDNARVGAVPHRPAGCAWTGAARIFRQERPRCFVGSNSSIASLNSRRPCDVPVQWSCRMGVCTLAR